MQLVGLHPRYTEAGRSLGLGSKHPRPRPQDFNILLRKAIFRNIKEEWVTFLPPPHPAFFWTWGTQKSCHQTCPQAFTCSVTSPSWHTSEEGTNPLPMLQLRTRGTGHVTVQALTVLCQSRISNQVCWSWPYFYFFSIFCLFLFFF